MASLVKQNVDFEPNSMAEQAKTQKPLLPQGRPMTFGMALSQNGDKVQKTLSLDRRITVAKPFHAGLSPFVRAHTRKCSGIDPGLNEWRVWSSLISNVHSGFR